MQEKMPCTPGIGDENVFYNGAAYQVNVTNNTENPIQGRYALISCIPNDQGEATGCPDPLF